MKKNILLTMLSMTAFVLSAQASIGMSISTQVQANDSLSGIPSYPENADTIKIVPDTSTIHVLPLDTAWFDLRKYKDKLNLTEIQRSIIPNIPTRTLDTTLPVGSIAGSADVTQTGAATYTIPIAVAPGRNGLQPQLSLNYSSQTGNGLAGYGWNMSGLSMIGRCGKSYYYDNNCTSPNFTTSDELMFDGARLLLLSGTRLTSGAHYRLENDPSTDIVCQSGSDGIYFTVKKKDGTVMQYGQTSAAQVKNSETGWVTAYWLLQSVTDKWGNTMSYLYDYSSSRDEFWLNDIYYDGGRVSFEYENRGDTESYYMAGAMFRSSKRLISIESTALTTFSEYQLIYDTTGRYSRLTDITRYGHDGSHYNSTHIDYDGGTQQDEDVAYYSEPRNNTLQVMIAYGDFDGDGRTDYISYPVSYGNSTVYASVYLARESYGSPMFTKTDSIQLMGNLIDVIVADFNGDGMSDVISKYKISNNIYQFYSYTSSDTGLTYNHYVCSSAKPTVLMGDFNGDGEMEFFATAEKKLYKLDGTVLVTGVIDDAGRDYLEDSKSGVKYYCDLNGNGKTEIVVVGSSDAYVYELDGSSFTKLNNFTTSLLCGNYTLTIGDFNGDGLTDFLKQDKTNKNSVAIVYSTGNGFYSQSVTVSGITKDLLIGDFNRDGKTDIFHYNTSGSFLTMTTGLNNGNGFTMSSKTSVCLSSFFINSIDLLKNSLQTGDFDGDGRSDFICTDFYCYAIINTFNDSWQPLAVGVSDGLGLQTTFSYSTMNDEGICSNQYNYSTFPLAGMTTPLYLVSNMEQSTGGYNNSTSYFYKRPKWHMQGRGFLGFAEVTATNTAQDREVISTYEVDGTYYYPKLTKQEVQTASGSYISKSEFTYTNKTFGPAKCFFPFASTTIETDYLRGNAVTTYMNMDIYGNVTSRSTVYGDGRVDNHIISYSNINGNPWILGLPVYEAEINVDGGSTWQKCRNFTYGSNYELTGTLDYIGTTANKTAETTYTYDSYGNLASQTVKPYDATTGQTTSYTYNYGGLYLSSKTDPAGIVTNYTYNNFGELEIEYNGGKRCVRTYDGMGRLVSEAWDGGKSVQISRSWDSSLSCSLYKVTTTSNADPESIVWYDAAGRELRTATTRFDGYSLFQDKTYDSAGRISSVSLPRKSGTAQYDSYSYDSYGRLSSISHATGGTTSYSYSGNSTTTIKDGIYIRRTTNVRGDLIESQDIMGNITYSLRPDGQPASITASMTTSDDVVTTFTYDNLGRRTAINDPSAGTRSFVYNNDGTLYSETDADGRSTTMTYDANLRLSTKTTPQQTYTYSYNSYGLLASITSTGGSGVELTYDYYHRLSAQKDYAAGNKWMERSFTYTNGNVSQVSYTSDMGSIGTEQYTYTNGTLTKISFAGQDVWELDAENSLGQTTSVSSGPLTRTTAYASNGLLTGIAVANGNSTLQNFGYSFDGTKGNLTWRKDILRNKQEDFLYDNMNRLTYNGSIYTSYSNNGNVTYRSDTNSSLYYDDSSRPYAVTGMSSTQSVLPTATQDVIYNVQGRPLSISENGKSATFAYDADGNRCQMSLYNGTTLLLTRYYAGDRLEEDITPSGTTARFYVGGDAYTASAVYVYNGSSWSLHYIGRDHLGSITLVTSSNGTTEYEYSYDAWGRLRNPLNQQIYALGQEPALYLARGYCGHEHLQDFGLINMNARLYDPLTGRFLSPDPYVQAPDFTQGLNRYSYCLNNPLKFKDPSGTLFLWDDWLIGGIKGLGGSPAHSAKRHVRNAFNIWKGLFSTDSNKNFWCRSWELFSRFSYQLPQVSVGFLLAHSTNINMFINVSNVDNGYGATAIGIEGREEGQGFALGNYLFGHENIKADASDCDFQHEYGHYIQSQIVGPAYFARVALPSLYATLTEKGNDNLIQPVELDASIRGFIYFNKHVTGFYSTSSEWTSHKLEGTDYYGWDFDSNPLTKYGEGRFEDYYTYKQYWDSGQIPSYVNWYNCLMPRLMLFYSGIISKNNGYELYY